MAKTSSSKLKRIQTTLDNQRYFNVVGSGVDAWVGKKNFLSTKSVQGTKIVSIESEVEYFDRPLRANMQPKVGRVAFAKMKDTFKVLLADEVLSKNYILSTGFALIEPSISSTYLYQYFQSETFNNQKNRYSEGSTQQAISKRDFSKLLIEFPENKREQEKIAEILGLIDQAIERSDALINKYERIRIGIRQDLFKYGIDEKGQVRSEKTHKFKKTPIGSVPVEWDVKPLGNLREYITSGSRGWAQYYSNEGALFLRIGNLSRETVNLRFDDTVYVQAPKDSEGNRTKTKAGDVLISITADLGITALVPDGLGDAYVNQHIALLRFADSKTLSPWIAFYLSSSKGQKQFTALNDGGAKAGLNLPTVDGIIVPIPPKEEREMIVKAIISSDEVIENERRQKRKLENLKKGLMTDLLFGTVRTDHLIKS